MSGRRALRLRQCIHFARQRGILSRRSTAGSSTLVARHRQVHAPCEIETGNGHKRRRAQRTHRGGVLAYKSACRNRLAHEITFAHFASKLWAAPEIARNAEQSSDRLWRRDALEWRMPTQTRSSTESLPLTE